MLTLHYMVTIYYDLLYDQTGVHDSLNCHPRGRTRGHTGARGAGVPAGMPARELSPDEFESVDF